MNQLAVGERIHRELLLCTGNQLARVGGREVVLLEQLFDLCDHRMCTGELSRTDCFLDASNLRQKSLHRLVATSSSLQELTLLLLEGTLLRIPGLGSRRTRLGALWRDRGKVPGNLHRLAREESEDTAHANRAMVHDPRLLAVLRPHLLFGLSVRGRLFDKIFHSLLL